jgi:hypothetical protein
MEALVNFLESIIGPSSKGSGSNYKFVCPLPSCSGKNSNLRGDKKFEINVDTKYDKGRPVNSWHCWICDNKGKSVYSLLKSMNCPKNVFEQLSELFKYTDFNITDNKILANGQVSLPKEYKSLSGKILKKELKLRHAKVYLKNRGITEDDIQKYFIGYCDGGEYDGRVIVPIHDNKGKVIYFVARSIHEDVIPKYKYPTSSKDFIANELYINTSEPLIVCEGIFDAISIKRNVVPLLGKTLPESLLIKIAESKCKKIYLALDPDAKNQTVKYANFLLNEGKHVFLVDYKGFKDANEMGFEAFTLAIQKAERLTLNKLMKMKISG